MSDQKSMPRSDAMISSSPADANHQSQKTPSDPTQIPQALKGLAEGVLGQAKQAAETQVTDQKARVADSLGDVAHALRQATSARHEPVIDTVRPYVEKAADQVERVSSYIHERSIRDMGGDLESFARREPALFLGGAFALGLLGGRFLKSSAPQSSHTNGSSSSMHSPRNNNGNGQHQAQKASGNGVGSDTTKRDAAQTGSSMNGTNGQNGKSQGNEKSQGQGKDASSREETSGAHYGATHNQNKGHK